MTPAELQAEGYDLSEIERKLASSSASPDRLSQLNTAELLTTFGEVAILYTKLGAELNRRINNR